MNPSVNWYFSKTSKWQEAFILLREILLQTELQEDLKWGHPCYSLGKSNVVLMHGFKNYCALLFMKGSILKDPKNLLIQQTENVQAARQLRFTSVNDIEKNRLAIKVIIKDAIAKEKAGVKVELKKTKEYKMSQEFTDILKEMPELAVAFKALTPGRQRGYLLFFNAAKQSSTRSSRVEKYIQAILDGKGLND